MTDHLLRARAPISDAGWELLDREARERLAPALAARKLVDFSGPLGWEHSATNLGRTRPLSSAPSEGVSGLQRQVLTLAELRADFAGRLRLARRREHVPLPRRDLHLPRCDARGRGRTLVTGYCPTGRRGHGSRPTMRR